MAEGFVSAQQDALINLGNMWMERSARLVATMTNRKVSILNGLFKETRKEEIEKDFSTSKFVAEVSLEGRTPIYLFFNAEDAAIIVDLVIGGDGKGVTVEFSDLHLSVLEEAVNEMSGVLAELYNTLFGSSHKVLPTKGQVDGLDALGDKNLAQLSFELVIEGLVNSKIHVFFDADSAHDLAERLFNISPETIDSLSQLPAGEPPASPTIAPPPVVASYSGVAPSQTRTQVPLENAVPSPPIPKQSPIMEVPPALSYSSSIPAATAVVDREVSVRQVQLPELTPRTPSARVGNLDLILDVTLQLTAVLGRTAILIKDLISLGPGSVLELDKLAGEPVELLVNNKLVARGEVVVIDEKFGIRITDIVSQAERIQGLKG